MSAELPLATVNLEHCPNVCRITPELQIYLLIDNVFLGFGLRLTDADIPINMLSQYTTVLSTSVR